MAGETWAPVEPTLGMRWQTQTYDCLLYKIAYVNPYLQKLTENFRSLPHPVAN